MQQALLNLDDRIQTGQLLRFAIETNTQGVPLSVELVLYEPAVDAVIQRFVISEASEDAGGGVVETFPRPQPKPGVIQPKPSPRPLSGRIKAQGDDGDSGS